MVVRVAGQMLRWSVIMAFGFGSCPPGDVYKSNRPWAGEDVGQFVSHMDMVIGKPYSVKRDENWDCSLQKAKRRLRN